MLWICVIHIAFHPSHTRIFNNIPVCEPLRSPIPKMKTGYTKCINNSLSSTPTLYYIIRSIHQTHSTTHLCITYIPLQPTFIKCEGDRKGTSTRRVPCTHTISIFKINIQALYDPQRFTQTHRKQRKDIQKRHSPQSGWFVLRLIYALPTKYRSLKIQTSYHKNVHIPNVWFCLHTMGIRSEFSWK